MKVKRYIAPLLTAIITLLLVCTPLATVKAAPTESSWPGVKLPSAEIYAHDNGTLTTFREAVCTQQANDYSSYIASRVPSDNQDYSTNNQADDWLIQYCSRMRAVGEGNTLYYTEYKKNSNLKRIVAKSKNIVLWTYTFNASGCNYYNNINDVSLGYDGNLYISAYRYTGCSTADVVLISINSKTGEKRFEKSLPNPYSAVNNGAPHEIFPYEKGIATVSNTTWDKSPVIHYYGYDGILDNSKTFTPRITTDGTITQNISISPNGRTYFIGFIQTYPNPPVSKVYYKDISSSTVNELTLSIPSTSINEIIPASNNKALVRWYQNSAYGITYLNSDNTESFSANLSNEGSSSLVSSAYTALDNNDNVLTAKVMSIGQKRIAYVDKYTPSGAKSRLFDSDAEYGTTSTDKFSISTFSDNSIGNGALYLTLCKQVSFTSLSYCRNEDNPKIISIPYSSTYSYQRNTLLQRWNSDNDGDGLTASQEVTQSTSDFSKDTDQDGLSDYLESFNYPGRASLFCNSTQSYCEYPSPAQKDLYVEIDWMSKPTDQGYSSNAYETKPSSAQLNAIKSSYANKGILAHFDTGQLGGGNEVPFQQVVRFEETANAPDFYNYKHGGDGLQANFDPNRYQIYHYMLSGYQYQDLGSSGASRAGDDDVFIAYGALRDSPITINLDNTISGVIMHELGHNLCLTDLNPKNDGTPYYPSQPASCRFAGIDSYSGNPYPSVMNYSKQHSGLVDYSTGQGGQGDHDDWGAIRLYDFANQTMGDPQTNPTTYRMNSYSRTTDKNRVPDSVIHGQTIKRLR